MTYPIIKISSYPAWVGKDGKPKPGCIPNDTDLYKELHRIKSGYYKAIVDTYRGITDKDEADKFKVSKLPSLTISGIFKKWRKEENLVQHTGLLNIDIDAKKNQHIQDWEALRDSIFEMDGVVACFLSVSGRGCTFIVRIIPEQHKDSFFSIVDGLRQYFNINADTGLHDVTRLRFVSDDKGCKFRTDFNAIPISYPSYEYLQSKKHYGSQTASLEPIGDADSEYNFNEAMKKAEASYPFVEGNKHSHLIRVAAACNIMGMSIGYAEAQVIKHYRSRTDISDERLLKPTKDIYKLYKQQHGTFSTSFKTEQLNERARSFIIPFLHAGTKPSDQECLQFCEDNNINKDRIEQLIERIYNEYSNEFGLNKFPKIKKVEIWLNKRWSFKFNIVTAQPEIKTLGSDDLITINPDEIYRQLQLNKQQLSLTDVKSLIKSEFVKPYDPIKDYFHSLTWDGKDYISQLANYIKTSEGEFWPKMFKKSLIRSIPCGLGLKENRIVMVLYQRKEETGKSSYIRFINPWGESKYFTESPIIGGNTKDTEIRFSENFIYNIEELAGLNRADINKLKADISKSVIKERRPHAMFEISAPRRCNFWASTNQKEFLHDEGNTRWLVFEVQDINWAYSNEINIHKVWGQAWQLYKDSPQSGELEKEDRAIREFLNNDYRYIRPEEELFSRYFVPCKEKEGKFYSATEIAIYLNKFSPNLKINPNNIGKTIKNLYDLDSCQVKINGKNTRGYWLHDGFTDAEGEKGRSVWQPQNGEGF